MACRLLPKKTRRIFASSDFVTPNAVEKSLIFRFVIPSEVEGSRCDSRKVTSAGSQRGCYLATTPTKSRTVFSSGIDNAVPSWLRNQNALDEPPSRLSDAG